MAVRDERLMRRFGQALRRRRVAAGLSQEALAEAASLSNAYVSQLERGLKSPSLTAIAALARALKTTAAELVSEAERS